MVAIRILIITGSLLSLISSLKKKPYEAHIQHLLDTTDYNYADNGFPTNAQEQKQPIPLKVMGQIPAWLQGQLIQNGPGQFNVGKQQLVHWFDGFAFLTAFDFNQKQIHYQSAFLQSDPFQESLKNKDLRLISFAQLLPKPKTYHLAHGKQKVQSSNANINIQPLLDKRVIALGETPVPLEFDPATLNTIGFFDFQDKLKKMDMWESAHMKQDPLDGTIYNFYIDYGLQSAYVLYQLKKGENKRMVLKRQPINEPSYMHDFSITPHYIILTAYPLVVNPRDINDPRYSFIGAHRWEPARKTKVYVFDKKTGKKCAELDTEPMFAFHHILAAEDAEGLINIYLTSFQNADMVAKVSKLEVNLSQGLRKMVIDIKNACVKMHTLSQETYELPGINNEYAGQENKYFYAVCYQAPHLPKGFGLVKYNLQTNQANYWSEAQVFCGEPTFVPNPTGVTEDDGVIITVAYNAATNKSFLLMLNANTLQELARAYLPQPLPMRLHAKFIPAA